MSNNQNIPIEADIAIVGSGVSGLYCAWRLLRQDPSRKIVILDRLNRTGGRLQTDLIRIESLEGEQEVVREEEGGMRFTYNMNELMSLFDALNLCHEIVQFPMQTKPVDNRRDYFRGHSFTVAESSEDDNAIWGEIYNLAPAERNQSPDSILSTVYNRILIENRVAEAPADPTPEFWQKFRLDYTWDGVTLNRWTLWGLLRAMGYTEECVVMLAHTIGFESPYLSLMNAGEAFQLLEDFPSDPNFYTFRKGYSTLPNALKTQVEDMGGQIFLSTNLDSIDAADGGGFKLRLTVAPHGKNSSPLVAGGSPAEISAPQVILALARKALETLFATSPPFHTSPNAPEIWDALLTTTNQRLCKINLYYEDAWWDNQGLTGQPPITYGPSFTDLPANTVYPFYPIDGPSATNPAALTIYCDYNNTNFWQGLQSVGLLFDSPLQKKNSPVKNSPVPQTIFAASQAVVAEATRQFREIFSTHWVPEPILTSFRLWDGEEDFGYAVHQWALDADDRSVMKLLAEPIAGLFTCNEAYSDMQGWVNGSLRSSELVLAKFGLASIVHEFERCQEPDSTETT